MQATTLCQIAAAHVDNGSCDCLARLLEEASSQFRLMVVEGGGSSHRRGSGDPLSRQQLQAPLCCKLRIANKDSVRTQLGTTLSVMASAHVAQLPTARSDQQERGHRYAQLALNMACSGVQSSRLLKEQQINWKARLAGKEALGIQQSVPHLRCLRW